MNSHRKQIQRLKFKTSKCGILSLFVLVKAAGIIMYDGIKNKYTKHLRKKTSDSSSFYMQEVSNTTIQSNNFFLQFFFSYKIISYDCALTCNKNGWVVLSTVMFWFIKFLLSENWENPLGRKVWLLMEMLLFEERGAERYPPWCCIPWFPPPWFYKY